MNHPVRGGGCALAEWRDRQSAARSGGADLIQFKIHAFRCECVERGHNPLVWDATRAATLEAGSISVGDQLA
jgi:hypothetical protein